MNPKDPDRAERLIRQATGNARAPVRMRADDQNLLKKREEMAREQGRILAPPPPAGLQGDMSRIIWADERDKDGNPFPLGTKNPELAAYGDEHGTRCAYLATKVFAPRLGLGIAEIPIVTGLAMFHDLGRTRPWQAQDDHAALSAARADEAMRNHPTAWNEANVRDEVCRLIAQHSLKGPPPSDKRLIALWEADCWESVRLAPRTREGVVVMEERLAMCITPWGRDEENQRKWRDHVGGW